MATNTYVALDKVTVGTATSSITFTGISGAYADLFVVCSILPSSTSFYTPSLQFNNDTTSNYSSTWIYGQGTSAVSSRNSSQTQMALDNYAATPAVGYPMTVNFSVMNYSNTTTYKTVLSRGNDVFASAGETSATVGLWRSTSAITSLTVKGNGANFAVGSTFSLYGIKAEPVWAAKATGGTITNDVQYTYHTFTASGTFTPSQTLSCDYLVVAGGGGGGGGRSGGGGGAGGFRTGSALSISAAAQTITVGAGGAGATVGGNTQNGSSGANSSIASLISSTGGGYGKGTGASGVNAGSGGSGGGSNEQPSGGSGNAGSYSPVEGYGGGRGYTSSLDCGGGGGGASAVGGDGVLNVRGGNGGNGMASSISGTSVTYAGGGGGGIDDTTAGTGGTGGGGTGGSSPTYATSGTANLGGGGGGAGDKGSPVTPAGSGGSGIVIIRYAN
jgi:hypothetical protein